MLPGYDTILGIVKGIGRGIASASLAERLAACILIPSSTLEDNNLSRSSSCRSSSTSHAQTPRPMTKVENARRSVSQSKSVTDKNQSFCTHEGIAGPATVSSLLEPTSQVRSYGSFSTHQRLQDEFEVSEVPEIPPKASIATKRIKSAAFSRKPSVAQPLRQHHGRGRDEERRDSASSTSSDSARDSSPVPEFKIVISPP